MKNETLEIIVKKICEALSYVYPMNLFIHLKEVHREVYSQKVRRKIKNKPINFVTVPPVFLKGGEYMEIGGKFWADQNFILQCWDRYENSQYTPRLVIGDNAHIGSNSHIGCINSITIGDNLLTGSNVYITDHYHGDSTNENTELAPIKRKLVSKGKVVIGDNVWLGNNVIIMPGVTIGNNVTIGANAVVTKDIPDNSVAVGVPAKGYKK